MDAAATLNETERNTRIAVLKQERKEALLHLTQGANALQMETEDLSLTVDVETGQADALVLKGKNTGRMWSELSALEKGQTVSVMAEGTSVLLDILRVAAGE